MPDQAPVVEPWDAPSAVEGAIRAAGPSRHILAANFALRLARLGHVREVSVTVAGGPKAAEAVRRVLAELAASEAPEDAPDETALEAVVGAQDEGAPPDPRETIPGGANRFPQGGTDAVQDRLLAILAVGPSHTRSLAAQLGRRVAVVLAALHGLERAGRVVRSRKTGRGTRWARRCAAV